MSTGVLLYCFNTPEVNYHLMAERCVEQIKKYLKLAEQFFSRIEKRYINSKIYHSYAVEKVFLEDYAYLINTCIDLSDKTMNFKYKNLP